MTEKLEKIVTRTKSTAKVVLSALLLGAALNYASCKESTPPEQECCNCIVGNGCTTASKNQCMNLFYGGDPITVYNECVRVNGCYMPCAEAGAYFR